MSPELFDPEMFDLKEHRPTKYSDRYALGMVVYEVLSGQVPFSQYHGYAIVARVLKGKRPGRPLGAEGTWFTDEIWSILERCWKPVPGDRPRIGEVLECLGRVSRTWIPPSPETTVGSSTRDPATHGPDSSEEESIDESELSPSSRVGSSQPSRRLRPTGDQNENII